MTESEAAEVLEARARSLARPARTMQSERAEGEAFLTFALAAETWALELKLVKEVLIAREIATLPRAELPLVGLITWRGDVLNVIDLAAVIGTAQRGTDTRIIVVGAGRATFALIADAMSGIRTIDLRALRPARSGPGSAYVRGVSSDSLVVLDTSQLLQFYS